VGGGEAGEKHAVVRRTERVYLFTSKRIALVGGYGFEGLCSRRGLRRRDVTSILLSEEGILWASFLAAACRELCWKEGRGAGYPWGVSGNRRRVRTDELEDKGGFVY
jgi:hypothetical protein